LCCFRGLETLCFVLRSPIFTSSRMEQMSEEEYKRFNKTKPREARLRREDFGDPSKIGTFKGPWAKFEGVGSKQRNDTRALKRVVNKHCLEPNSERCRRSTSHPMDKYSSLDRCSVRKCIAPSSNAMLFHEHRDAASSVRLFNNYNLLLSAGHDGKAILYSLQGEVLAVFMGHSKAVPSALLGRKEDTFSTVSLDGFVKHWNVETGRCLVRINCGFPLTCQAENKEAHFVGSFDGKIQRIDFRSKEPIGLVEGRQKIESLCAIGDVLGYVRGDGHLCFLDLRSQDILKEHSAGYSSLDYNEKKDRVVVSSPFSASLFDTLLEQDTVELISECTAGARLSPDGRYLYYGGRDGGIYLVDCETLDTKTIGFSNAELRAVDWAPGDSINFASGDALGFVKAWR
jgi:pre-mRNA-processing factor 17